MRIVPLECCHLSQLKLQPAQAQLSELAADPEYAQGLIEAGPAFAGIVNDRVVGCAGVVKLAEQRGHAWALLGDDAGGSLTTIHRAIVRFLADQPYRRIETSVDSEFIAGHRWVLMLGFNCEGRMHCYGPNGRDADLYARIRI